MAAPGMVHPEDKGVELMEFPTTAKAELDLIRKIAKPIKKKAAKFR